MSDTNYVKYFVLETMLHGIADISGRMLNLKLPAIGF